MLISLNLLSFSWNLLSFYVWLNMYMVDGSNNLYLRYFSFIFVVIFMCLECRVYGCVY